MAIWNDYRKARASSGHTVVGDLRILEDVFSPQLGNRRDILVYLPPSYRSGARHYTVLYLHDGQNLFDDATSFAGEWRVDETMEALGAESIEAIVVGIPNAGTARLDEYSPFRDPVAGGGQGDLYLSFLVETVKPLIDADFRTRPDRDHTGIMGSSMGGLISLYAFFHCREVFGFAGVMSPSLWFAREAIYDYVRNAPFARGRLYLDTGTREHDHGTGGWLARVSRSRGYYAGVRRMQRLLVRKGYRPRHNLLYVEEKWAKHHEQAWARRLPRAIRFLISGTVSAKPPQPAP